MSAEIKNVSGGSTVLDWEPTGFKSLKSKGHAKLSQHFK